MWVKKQFNSERIYFLGFLESANFHRAAPPPSWDRDCFNVACVCVCMCPVQKESGVHTHTQTRTFSHHRARPQTSSHTHPIAHTAAHNTRARIHTRSHTHLHTTFLQRSCNLLPCSGLFLQCEKLITLFTRRMNEQRSTAQMTSRQRSSVSRDGLCT